MDRQFYAWVLVREWGEEDRDVRVGPFTVADEDELRDNLEAAGDIVSGIEPA